MILLLSTIILSVSVGCFTEFGNNSEKYLNLSSCILKVAEQLKTKKLVFIQEEVENDEFPSIVEINWERVIISSNNVSSVSGIFLFLPNSNTSLSYDKIFAVKYLDYNSVYIICTDNFNVMYLFFDIAWSFKVIDAIAFYPSRRNNKISVYTYFPFGVWGCAVTDPVRINIYDTSTGTFKINEKVFSKKRKLSNLYKCPVRVTLKDRRSEVAPNYYPEEKLETVERLFKLVESRMNFTSEVVVADKEANTYAAAYYNFTSAAVLSIVKGDSEIAIGRFTQLIDYHENTLAPAQTSMDCFTWAVPTKSGKKPSVWTTSLFEFDITTWILLILCFIFCAFIFHMISVHISNYDHPTLSLLGMLLNISVNMKFTSNPVRVFVAHWLLFCLVVMAAYSASLGSLVTVPPDSSNIKTTAELLEKDVLLWGEPKMYHILSASSETSNDIKRVLQKFVILRPGEFDKILYDIYINRNKAIFYTKSQLIQEENRIRQENKITNLIHIVPDCLIRSHTAPLILRKGSILTEPVKKIVIRLMEAGIINYWSRIEGEALNPRSTSNEVQKFTVSQMRGAIIVIIAGYIISMAAFIYEHYLEKIQFSNIHKKSKNKHTWIKIFSCGMNKKQKKNLV